MESTFETQIELSADTRVALLLCSGLSASTGLKPLTPGEYNSLAIWLNQHNRRPSDLLSDGAEGNLPEGPGLPATEHLRSLLDRGRLLSLALTKWADFGIWVLSRSDSNYPERLRRLRGAAPPLLYGVGSMSLLNRGGLAIVGSRDIDEEGITFTRDVARRCAEHQIQVVSGGARGVDREALGSALEAGGTTIAVPVESLLKVVTERTARNAIRDQCLTAITPYDPEHGFTVGRAMGRNKYIYALADYALIVRFARGEGGTWAGAVEQLDRNKPSSARVPVFVRVTHNPEDGLRQLRAKGALPFPEEEFWKADVTDVLSRAALPSTDLFQAAPASDSPAPVPVADDTSTASPVQPTQPEETHLSDKATFATPPLSVPAVTDPIAAETDSCYALCLPLLLQLLREEKTKKQLPDIAKQLGLVPQQFNKWFERAIKEGKLTSKKKGRQTVFVDATLTANPTLFDRGGDAA